MKKIILYTVIIFFSLNLYCQNKDLGVFLGASYYNGDYNEIMPFNPPSLAFGLMFSHSLDKLTVIRFQIDKGALRGTNEHPFNQNIFDAGIMFEKNFFKFNYNPIRGAVPFTPYVAAGGFILIAPGNASSVNLSIPVGLGFKYALSEMATLSFEWTLHFTNTDILDETGSDLQISNKKLRVTNDFYSFVGVVLKYNLFYEDHLCPAYN